MDRYRTPMSTIVVMRGFLVSSIGVACRGRPGPSARPVLRSRPAAPRPPAGRSPDRRSRHPAAPSRCRPGRPSPRDRAPRGAPGEQGLTQRDVQPFSLVGVVWDDAGRRRCTAAVQVRTRAVGHRPLVRLAGRRDPQQRRTPPTPARPSATRAGCAAATAPLWVGASDGVEVRVRPEAAPARRTAGSSANSAAQAPLPKGLRLELVDPGEEPPPAGEPAPGDEPVPGGDARRSRRPGVLTAESAASSAVNADLAPRSAPTPIPALDQGRPSRAHRRPAAARPTRRPPRTSARARASSPARAGAPTRSCARRAFGYTANGQGGLRPPQRHRQQLHLQAGPLGPAQYLPLPREEQRLAGHRLQLRSSTSAATSTRAARAASPSRSWARTPSASTRTAWAVAVLGTFSSSKPPAAAVDAVARLTAWKLGLFGVNPQR